MKAKIGEDIWADTAFVELQDLEKLAALWLITNANLLGYVEVSAKKLRRDLEAPIDVIEAACKGLARGFVKTEKGVWLRNYIRRQLGDGEGLTKNNVFKSLGKLLAGMPEEVVKLVIEEYPVIASTLQAPSEINEGGRGHQGEGEGVREGVSMERGAGENLPDLGDLTAGQHVVLVKSRLNKIFGRKPNTPLSYLAEDALARAGAISADDLAALEWFYSLPPDDSIDEMKWRRKDADKLAINLLADIDRAKAFQKKNGPTKKESGANRRKLTAEESAWLLETYGEPGADFRLPEFYDQLPPDIVRNLTSRNGPEKK